MPTALVTGASAGIGEQFARQLAARGHDLVLVARSRDKLESLAADVAGSATVIGCDLARDATSLADQVRERGLDVDLLVNNAGFGTHGPFVEQDPGREVDEVRLNCEAVVALTHAFLPGMIERRSGGVIVVASSAGFQPLPYEAVYSATKAFALTFTEALSEELRGSGVRCLAVNPGPVSTGWQQIAGMDDATQSKIPGHISAEQCVREALEAYDAGKRSIVPGAVFRWFTRLQPPAPTGLKLRITERLYRPGG